MICACLDLSVSSSSWCLGRVAVCDCGCPWIFSLPFLCYFVLVFFNPFSIAVTSLGEERADPSVFRTFVRFVLVWICLFPLPLGVWEGLRFVIVDVLGFFPYLVLCYFVLVFFNPFSIAFTSLGEERANLSAVRAFVRFERFWFCLFPLGVLEELRLVIVVIPGFFSYLFFSNAY